MNSGARPAPRDLMAKKFSTNSSKMATLSTTYMSKFKILTFLGSLEKARVSKRIALSQFTKNINTQYRLRGVLCMLRNMRSKRLCTHYFDLTVYNYSKILAFGAFLSRQKTLKKRTSGVLFVKCLNEEIQDSTLKRK